MVSKVCWHALVQMVYKRNSVISKQIKNISVLLLHFIFYSSELGGGNPFQNIDKTSVLQETRIFNDTPVNVRKCTHILTKILYLINQVCGLLCQSAR